MEYFLSKSYLKHINKKNPLGMGGQLADAYGSLMQELWNDKFSYTAPRTLKVRLVSVKQSFHSLVSCCFNVSVKYL